MSEPNYASFEPEGFAEGGGLLDDADVVIKAAGFQHFDYNGNAKTTTALRVAMEDQEGKLHEQYYSVGDPEKFAPSDDGKKVLLTGTATSINKKSNFAQFVTSLINSSMPPATIAGGDISGVVGIRIHVNAVAQKDKDGKTAKNNAGFDRTLLLATKYYGTGGAAAPATAAKPAAGAPKGAKKLAASAPAAVAPVSEEVADRVVRYITEAAKKSGGSIPRKKISAAVFQAAMTAKDPNKAELPKLAFDPAFLTTNSGRGVQVEEEFYAFEYDAATEEISAAA